ncbi:hypothetical protein BAUCODRAFT_25722 [Baudoinia panamericana UAMH 10762]|uniref:Uncharacterized protein n=1 Tax=Baudoinia panamericana (strain UAMH 10762) TaxID=717646 RepID=M2LK09_BAUPA|nr:uncharacterized protein BAUCODRAFT_25722 [Baudoinia panamericana UAMH 10762]EMC94557.1 hypothetical protein BAUCODRAFT_25722 [Baudoinia panamericana UAMH 10762]
MDEQTFQSQLHELKARIDDLTMKHFATSPRSSRHSGERDFTRQVRDVKNHLHRLDTSTRAALTNPEAGKEAVMTSLFRSSIPEVQQSSWLPHNDRMSLPSGPLFWQLFSSLRSDVQSIDMRVSNLEQTVSDLEDKVDRWNPDRFTPASSVARAAENAIHHTRCSSDYTPGSNTAAFPTDTWRCAGEEGDGVASSGLEPVHAAMPTTPIHGSDVKLRSKDRMIEELTRTQLDAVQASVHMLRTYNTVMNRDMTLLDGDNAKVVRKIVKLHSQLFDVGGHEAWEESAMPPSLPDVSQNAWTLELPCSPSRTPGLSTKTTCNPSLHPSDGQPAWSQQMFQQLLPVQDALSRIEEQLAKGNNNSDMVEQLQHRLVTGAYLGKTPSAHAEGVERAFRDQQDETRSLQQKHDELLRGYKEKSSALYASKVRAEELERTLRDVDAGRERFDQTVSDLQRFCEQKDVLLQNQGHVIARGAQLLEEKDDMLTSLNRTSEALQADLHDQRRQTLRLAGLLDHRNALLAEASQRAAKEGKQGPSAQRQGGGSNGPHEDFPKRSPPHAESPAQQLSKGRVMVQSGDGQLVERDIPAQNVQAQQVKDAYSSLYTKESRAQQPSASREVFELLQSGSRHGAANASPYLVAPADQRGTAFAWSPAPTQGHRRLVSEQRRASALARDADTTPVFGQPSPIGIAAQRDSSVERRHACERRAGEAAAKDRRQRMFASTASRNVDVPDRPTSSVPAPPYRARSMAQMREGSRNDGEMRRDIFRHQSVHDLNKRRELQAYAETDVESGGELGGDLLLLGGPLLTEALLRVIFILSPGHVTMSERDIRSPMSARSRDYDDDYDRRPSTRSRPDPDSPRDLGRAPKPRRRDNYDASDEDDVPPLRSPTSLDTGSRRPRRHRGSNDSSIPPPPIGKERSHNDYDDGVQPMRRPVENGHRDGPPPSRDRRRHGGSKNLDDMDAPPPSRDRRRHGRDSEDLGAPRRRDPPPRDYPPDEPRPRRSHRPYDDEETDYDAKPRRRSTRDHDKDRYDDRGYRSEAPKRGSRDDRDRGYRTDGRESSRRDRERRREKERARDRDDDYDRRDRDRRRSSGRRSSGQKRDKDKDKDKDLDLGKMLETGKKHWSKVEPIAKPMLGALASKYLDT